MAVASSRSAFRAPLGPSVGDLETAYPSSPARLVGRLEARKGQGEARQLLSSCDEPSSTKSKELHKCVALSPLLVSKSAGDDVKDEKTILLETEDY